ncbi:hypothetical protein FGO68_gene12694 [Halteria grandinella]|uniref:Uncharacterized protein n=1 Tax=Halteria grandinella TaxID=5974 RepID=A0A8J8T127_HALGN|nr:hypothetical protein FGO68_gene12694 [Halteria grandinella]
MADILHQFLSGVKDSLKFSQGFYDVLSSLELMKRTAQITLINGLIYFGSVFLYNTFMGGKSNETTPTVGEGNEVLGLIQSLLRLFFGLAYQGWIFIIYIMALTLTTFWVQDIFDELIQIKLKRALANENVISSSQSDNKGLSQSQIAKKPIKNPTKFLQKMQGLEVKTSAKEKSIDLIQRTSIITIYMIMTSLIVTVCKLMLIGPFLAGIVEVFLYSILHSYYCFEYKITVLDVDFLSSLVYFEAQWAYMSGFGFLFTMLLYLFKQQVGSSLFFLFFPLMVAVSLEESGQGLLAYKEERVAQSVSSIPVLTMAYYPHRWLLRKINAYVTKHDE